MAHTRHNMRVNTKNVINSTALWDPERATDTIDTIYLVLSTVYEHSVSAQHDEQYHVALVPYDSLY